MQTKKNKKKKSKNLTGNINKEILNLVIIFSSIITLISLYSKATGVVGKLIRIAVLSLFGFYGYIIPYVVIIVSALYMLRKLDIRKKINSILLMNLSIITIIHIIYLNSENMGFLDTLKTSIYFGQLGEGGGIVGGIFSFISLTLFGNVGSYILIVGIILISVLIFTDKSFFKILRKLVYQLNIFFKETAIMFKGIIGNNISKTIDKKKEKKQVKEKPLSSSKDSDFGEIKILDYNKIMNDNKDLEEEKEDSEKIEDLTSSKSTKDKPTKENMDYTVKMNKVESTQVDLYEDYQFPSIDILDKKEKKTNEKEEKKEVKKNADKLIEVLNDFGIDAKVSQVSIGPSITQYELQPAPGVKVSRIISLSNDIALGLASSDLRMEAPIPGKSAIGIEIPNKDKTGVGLREIIKSEEFEQIETKVPMALGKDISGKPIIADIEKMPHLLIAGATGSGKSVCINTLIASIIFKAKPNEVKLLMIDPKMVELSVYNGIPHLLIPVVTEPKKAAKALNWAVTEMNKRYKKFSEAGVRDRKGFNKKVDNASEKMPQIVIIIDELADLMMVSASEVEDYICRLAQMARAAGIHLIVATQRPSVDIITGTIKANIPSRISFAVSSQVDSRTILDTGGAEKLLGRGDMLFHPVGESKPIRLQGAFIDEHEVERIVDFLKIENEAEYEEKVIEEIEKEINISEEEDVDELYSTAVELILEEDQASISLLQRKLRIGYARAARIVDQMEERGVVGGHEGSKPRKILVTKDELNND